MPKQNGKWITIKLRPETAAMVAQFMSHDAFSSLSDFFETVLVVFQEHAQAVIAYIEQEEAKGLTHEEIFGLLKTEISFRRLDN